MMMEPFHERFLGIAEKETRCVIIPPGKRLPEASSFEHHHFIDKAKNEIIFISEHEDDYEKKLEEVESDNFIEIPIRTADDDFQMMKSFIYKLKDFSLTQKFDEALNRKKPFRNFRELIDQYQELKDQWFEHQSKEFINETMNFLCENNIELEDQSFMPKIDIKELSKDEVKLPEEFSGFGPVACLKCSNKEWFKKRYFEANMYNNNMLIDREIKKTMKEKFSIVDFGILAGGEKIILTSSECQKCKCSKIFEDL